MKKLTHLATFTASLLLAATLIAAARQAAPRPGVHPISGRQFAGVMGYQGAEWLDREERDIEEDPTSAVNALDLKPGMVVGDVGAGSGYLTVLLSKQVGPTGRVYGQDIQPEMIVPLQKRMVR